MELLKKLSNKQAPKINRKSILIVGLVGSGKINFLKSLLELIPKKRKGYCIC